MSTDRQSEIGKQLFFGFFLTNSLILKKLICLQLKNMYDFPRTPDSLTLTDGSITLSSTYQSSQSFDKEEINPNFAMSSSGEVLDDIVTCVSGKIFKRNFKERKSNK